LLHQQIWYCVIHVVHLVDKTYEVAYVFSTGSIRMQLGLCGTLSGSPHLGEFWKFTFF
jgi:hypothetical protein